MSFLMDLGQLLGLFLLMPGIVFFPCVALAALAALLVSFDRRAVWCYVGGLLGSLAGWLVLVVMGAHRWTQFATFVPAAALFWCVVSSQIVWEFQSRLSKKMKPVQESTGGEKEYDDPVRAKGERRTVRNVFIFLLVHYACVFSLLFILTFFYIILPARSATVSAPLGSSGAIGLFAAIILLAILISPVLSYLFWRRIRRWRHREYRVSLVTDLTVIIGVILFACFGMFVGVP